MPVLPIGEGAGNLSESEAVREQRFRAYRVTGKQLAALIAGSSAFEAPAADAEVYMVWQRDMNGAPGDWNYVVTVASNTFAPVGKGEIYPDGGPLPLGEPRGKVKFREFF